MDAEIISAVVAIEFKLETLCSTFDAVIPGKLDLSLIDRPFCHG